MSSPKLKFEWDDASCFVNGLKILGVHLTWHRELFLRKEIKEMVEAAYKQGFRDGAGKGPSTRENSGPSTTEKSDATEERKLEKDNILEH